MPRLEDVIITHGTERARQYPGADYRSNLAMFHAESGLGPLPKVDPDNMGEPALARVYLGRWLVDCGACASAVVIDDEDLVFLCPSCGSGGRWREVILPPERSDIEEILLMRPGFRDANRNRFWFPGESALKLAGENALHDSPFPERFEQPLQALADELLRFPIGDLEARLAENTITREELAELERLVLEFN